MITSRGFTLGISCCFCGGRLNIDAAHKTTRCDHCGSVLKIARATGYPTYIIRDPGRKAEIKFLIEQQLKQRGEPLVTKWESFTRLYVPFWQVSGTVIHIRTKPAGAMLRLAETIEVSADSHQVEVRIKPRQLSVCADSESGWRIQSLGVRPQVIDLEPLDQELVDKHKFARLTVGEQEARNLFVKSATSTGRLGAQTGSVSETMAVGMECMLLYFPVWTVAYSNANGRFRGQFDPLAKRLVSVENIFAETTSIAEHTPKIGQGIRIIPHRCPNCGSDFPVSDESVTFYCASCLRMYFDSKDGYQKIDLQIASGADHKDHLFPFWLIPLTGLSDPQNSEFVKTLSLIGFNTSQFYLPAFHITNPSKLMRMVSQYNGRANSIRFESSTKKVRSFANVVVTPLEATELLAPFTTAIKAKKGFKTSEAPFPPDISFGQPELVWLPYTLDRYFWRDTITGAAIEKAAVSL